MNKQEQITGPNNNPENGSITGILIIFNILALLSLAGLYFLAKRNNPPKVKIDLIRRIYEGLSPDETE